MTAMKWMLVATVGLAAIGFVASKTIVAARGPDAPRTLAPQGGSNVYFVAQQDPGAADTNPGTSEALSRPSPPR